MRKIISVATISAALATLAACSNTTAENAPVETVTTTATTTAMVTPSATASATTEVAAATFEKWDAVNLCMEKVMEQTGEITAPTFDLEGGITAQNGGWYMEGRVVWASGENPADFECLAKPGNPPTAFPVVMDLRELDKFIALIQEDSQ